MSKELLRSTTDKSILGVCGGLASFLGIPSLAVRLIFLVTLPVSFIVYLILANAVDEEPRLLNGRSGDRQRKAVMPRAGDSAEYGIQPV